MKFIKSLGFEQSVFDNCLFILRKTGEIFFLTLYVDDILIYASNIELLKELKTQFTDNFEMKDLGEVSQYLGMKITREDGVIKKDQNVGILMEHFQLLYGYVVCRYKIWLLNV